MAKNRFNVPDYTPRAEKKKEEFLIILKPCCVCGTPISAGYYGHWGDGGACSKKCNQEMEVRRESYITDS